MVRKITQPHGARVLEQQQQLLDQLAPEVGSPQIITEIDGSMVPLVEPSSRAGDRRKGRPLLWEEARLCMAREAGSVTPRFGAMLEDAEQAGAVWVDCVKRAGAGTATRIHGVGDGAAWIIAQARQRFGAQGHYLLDFYHVLE